MQSSNVDSFELYSLFYDQNSKMYIYNLIFWTAKYEFALEK